MHSAVASPTRLPAHTATFPLAAIPAIHPSRLLAIALTALLGTLALPAPLSAQDTQNGADDDWDVTLARGETREIDFTTEEGTWMSMDISPDGQCRADSHLIEVIDVTGT